MLCEECKQRPATVHLTRIVNNEKTEMHLCQECAQARGEFSFSLDPGFSLQNLLSSWFEMQMIPSNPAPQRMVAARVARCENCGLSLSDFRRLGQLGCPECYVTFDRNLDPLFRRIHGGTTHTGKVPKRAGGPRRAQKELETLREQLQQAIAKEEYEKAAELRDKIRALEQKGGGS